MPAGGIPPHPLGSDPVKQVENVVIGGGLAGSATAWWLAREGREVLLLEQFEQGHGRGSSHGPVRIFRLVYPVADYIRLAREALELWRLAEAECGQQLVELTGGIDIGPPESLARLKSALTAEGIEYDVLSAPEAEARFPGFRFEHDVLLQAQGGRCYADRAVAAFQAMAATHGADLHFEEPVLSVEEAGGKAVIRTGHEEYTAANCVVAAGAWVQRLVGERFALPPLRLTREQPAYFRSLVPGAAWPSFINHHPAGAGTFASYGLFAPGVGLKVGVHMSGAPVDPDVVPAVDDAVALAELRRVAAGLLPGVDPAPLSAERCLYTTTPNEDFVIERNGPIIVASPCSGHGFKFGPAIGRMVAEFALGRSQPPTRFRLRS